MSKSEFVKNKKNIKSRTASRVNVRQLKLSIKLAFVRDGGTFFQLEASQDVGKYDFTERASGNNCPHYLARQWRREAKKSLW